MLQGLGIPVRKHVWNVLRAVELPIIVGIEEKPIGRKIVSGHLGEDFCRRMVRGRR